MKSQTSTSMNTTKDNEVRRSQVRMGVNTALNKIGDYLDEIMFMSNEQIDFQLRGSNLKNK